MTTASIALTKDPNLQNILFDEFFSEHQTITVIAFNYDGGGTALCCCDGELAEIHKSNLRKIIFGSDKSSLEAFLQGIFDPETETDDIRRQNDTPVFRLSALNQMKRYDVANLAKQTLQKVHAQDGNHFSYYTLNTPCTEKSLPSPC